MSEFDVAFEKVSRLVEEFRSNESYYMSAKYQEAEARLDFIDKFWIALGWDVNHKIQTNPYEQEVKVEKGVATGGARRRADYAFSLAPNYRDVRFFVEAKKPAVDIESPVSCFQLIRYGWNSGTPAAVLTDFEQLLILDCRYRPVMETALSRIVAKHHYSEYTDREKFAKIYWWFSREAVDDGSIEKRAKELPKPRGRAVQRGLFPGGYQSIDESFLAELDEHRLALARMFKKHRPDLDSETLTELAQRTLDRLVFLRFLEDKGIEAQRLVENFGDKGTVWGDFIAASSRLNKIYNGIVYRRHGIMDDPKFIVDDTAFGDICESLAQINSPYDFNAIPIHILGSIYERFLGKVIIATAKRARVEEKPEVRKAGGVYYTPEYIVRYIVENTVGKMIAGKTPAQIAKMRFADIACGSGSFLLGVYDLLLKYHGQYYNDKPKRAKKGDCTERDGKLYLTLSKKREILLNNIYGVDIDNQAVEVCQLSLYLKLLQEETEASAKQYLLDFEHTAKMKQLLPDLTKNIICGNSLIGWDIDNDLFENGEIRKLNPMDFESAFPAVMKRGGFDAVVGNPPYGGTIDEHAKRYLQNRYVCQNYQLDSYLLFLERAVRDVLKQGGFYGMIIPNPWLTNLLQTNTRRFVTQNARVMEIVHFQFPVFRGVTVDTQIVILQKDQPAKWRVHVTVVRTQRAFEVGATKPDILKLEHDQDRWRSLDGGVINIFISEAEVELATKVASEGVPAGFLFDIKVGIKPYQVGKGTPPQTKQIVETRPFDSSTPVTKLHRLYLRGSDIARYVLSPAKARYLKYGPWLAEPRPGAHFDAPAKILIRQTGDSIVATIDCKQYLCLNNMHVLAPKNAEPSIEYSLGVLNSKLLNWYYHTLNPEIGEAFAEVKRTNVAALPIRTIDCSNAEG